MKTDHWFYGLFQSAQTLIALLLPAAGAADASAVPSLGPDSPGDALYRFEAPEIKAANHRLDGALWPRGSESGTPEQPVVLLEVQMQVLEVVVVVPHRRLRLGPDQLPRQLEGEARGRAAEAAAMAIRQLNRRCGPLTADTTARIQAMSVAQLEALAEALLDFKRSETR